MWAGIGFALLYALFIRPEVDLTVAPVRNPTYVTLSDGSIRNTYDVRLRNKHGEARVFELSVTGSDAYRIELENEADNTVNVPADAAHLQRVYVIAPQGTAPANGEASDVRIWVEDLESGRARA